MICRNFSHHSYLSTCEGKSTEKLWQEFKGEIDKIVDSYVPTKTLRGKKNLPWVTQEIRRKMNQRDHLYQVQKNTGKEEDRQKFKKVKYEADSMIKTSHNSYLDNLVGIIDDTDKVIKIENSRPNTKKLFSYLKNCRQNSQGSAPLKENGQVCTDNVKKANLLNKQFQSVFTPKSPLKLNQLCQKKMQDLHDAGNYSQNMSQPPDDTRNKYSNMPDLKISVNGIIKLL